MDDWRKKHIWLLASFLLTFGTVFLLAYLHLQRGTSFFPLDMNHRMENMTVMTFSALCIVRTVAEIIRHP